MNTNIPTKVEVPVDVYKTRQRTVQKYVAAQGLDAALIFSHEDIFYLTGYYAHLPWYPADLFRLAPLVIFRDREPLQVTTLVMTERFSRQGAVEDLATYDEYAGNAFEFLAQLFERIKLSKSRVGFDTTKVIVSTLNGLRQGSPNIEWVDTSAMMPSIRAIKDDYEIALLRRACDINRAGLAAAVEAAKPGAREHAVAAAAEHAMRLAGAERFTEETMVLSGKHVFDTRDRGNPERTIGDNQFVMFDMGAVFGGYCSDQATTIFLGTPTKEQRELIALAEDVYETTLKQIRPGMRACDIDAIAREKYAKSSLHGAHLAHMVGHGVGLEFHDIPLIKPGSETVIEPGMTFTFEPAVRYPGVGAVRYEKVFHVTKSGALEML